MPRNSSVFDAKSFLRRHLEAKMDIGMLWYDDDKKTPLADKVQKAVTFYAEKYGVKPNRCWVNPKQIDNPMTVSGVSVLANRTVIKNHLWIGIE